MSINVSASIVIKAKKIAVPAKLLDNTGKNIGEKNATISKASTIHLLGFNFFNIIGFKKLYANKDIIATINIGNIWEIIDFNISPPFT